MRSLPHDCPFFFPRAHPPPLTPPRLLQQWTEMDSSDSDEKEHDPGRDVAETQWELEYGALLRRLPPGMLGARNDPARLARLDMMAEQSDAARRRLRHWDDAGQISIAGLFDLVVEQRVRTRLLRDYFASWRAFVLVCRRRRQVFSSPGFQAKRDRRAGANTQ